MLNLDTHILIHALNDALTAPEKRVLAKNKWSISAIVLWEISKLNQIGRIELNLSDKKVIQALASIHMWPIDLKVCQTISKLDFYGDPADEIIAATSLVYEIPLVTRDKKIRGSKLIKFA